MSISIVPHDSLSGSGDCRWTSPTPPMQASIWPGVNICTLLYVCTLTRTPGLPKTPSFWTRLHSILTSIVVCFVCFLFPLKAKTNTSMRLSDSLIERWITMNAASCVSAPTLVTTRAHYTSRAVVKGEYHFCLAYFALCRIQLQFVAVLFVRSRSNSPIYSLTFISSLFLFLSFREALSALRSSQRQRPSLQRAR